VEWKSIIRAFLVNAIHGRIVQGGSTITQQLAKKAFLSDDRTITRKIKELILAVQLERRYTKDEILALYLNQIPYGSNAYGIEAASQTFFGKPAHDLTLGEAALLAALPKAPSYYSPWGSNVKALIARRDFLLGKMEADGFITNEEGADARNEKLEFTKPFQGIRAPHFVIEVQNYLNERYGEDFVKTHGLNVTTTLDEKLQELAETAVTEGTAKNQELYQGSNAALVAEDPRTGQMLAMVGSRDYFDIEHEGNFNVASQGLRQPGSATKPFIYAAAFEKGYTPETTVFDVATEFDTTKDLEKSYQPQDYDGKFRGPVTLRQALAQSLNIPSVKVLYLVGMDDALTTLRSFGLSTLTERSRYGLSLILGGGEVRLIDLVGAYAALAEDGTHHDQSFILKVETKDNVLEEYHDHTSDVISPQPARLVNDILSDQDARAPIFGASLNLPGVLDHQVAVKTGTSNDYRDAWTIGYTPSLVIGVWAGNNDNTPMTKAGGNLAAAPIWRNVMSQALTDLPPESFTKPGDEAPPTKPVLRGDYVITYQNGVNLFPQLHSILFYVDRNNPRGDEPVTPERDPQFSNWETPVLEWGKTHIPHFETFNQLIPAGSTALTDATSTLITPLTISVSSPISGSFIANPLRIEADLTSHESIIKIEVTLNDRIIDTRTGDFGSRFHYSGTIPVSTLDLQNILRVSAETKTGARENAELIVFKQT
jgi:penicillin-binding protein 1C